MSLCTPHPEVSCCEAPAIVGFSSGGTGCGSGGGVSVYWRLGGRGLPCRHNRGQLLWKLHNFLTPTILDILDFARDGSHGILLTTTRAGKVHTYMVSGQTGKATHLWLDENNFGGHTRVGKLLPGVAGVQIAATASGQTPPAAHSGDVRLVSFERGLERPHFRVRQHVTGVFDSPLILVADLDGDGHEEVVVISHEQVWACNVRSCRASRANRPPGPWPARTA